jgi:hypothetical protein
VVERLSDYRKSDHDKLFMDADQASKFFHLERGRLTWNDNPGWGAKYERMHGDEKRLQGILRDHLMAEAEFEESEITRQFEAERDALYEQQEQLFRAVCVIPCVSLRAIQAKATFAIDILVPSGEFDTLIEELLKSMRGAHA